MWLFSTSKLVHKTTAVITRVVLFKSEYIIWRETKLGVRNVFVLYAVNGIR